MTTQTLRQRGALAHNRTQIAAVAGVVIVAAISGALILSAVIRPAGQAPWSLTNTAVSIERPIGVGFTPFAGPVERMSASQLVDRYGLQTGFLERAGDGSFDLAAAQLRTASTYGLRSGFLESGGAVPALVAATEVEHGFQP